MTMTTEETSIDNTGDSTTLLTTTFSTITTGIIIISILSEYSILLFRTVVSGGGPNQSAIGIGAGVGGAVIATIIIAIIIAILVVVGTFIRRGKECLVSVISLCKH